LTSTECPSGEIALASRYGPTTLSTPFTSRSLDVVSATTALNSGLVASSSLFWIRTTSSAFSGYALKTALSALPDSPTPDSWSFSVSAGSAFIPMKVATTTKASHPKIAFLRCRALQ
jgi:hypothetical protein